jgi:hypothetical protein
VALALEPARVTVEAQDLGSELRLRIRWRQTGEESWEPSSIRVVGSAPPWVEREGVLRPVAAVADGEALDVLVRGALRIPEEDLPVFLGSTLPALESQGIPVEVSGEVARNLVVRPSPEPRLDLREERGALVGTLRFRYGDYEIPAETPAPVLALGTGAEKVFLHRDMEAEFQATARLRSLGFRTPEPGCFELDGDPALWSLLPRNGGCSDGTTSASTRCASPP